MPKWTDADKEKLSNLADFGLSCRMAGKVLGRSERATASAAIRLDISFDSSKHGDLIKLLERGGFIGRENLGGSVGVRWFPANRSGGSYSHEFCEMLLELGVLVNDHGEVFRHA